MASTSKRPLPIVRVFVSSTFSDLKHERNALHSQVWPELERYCQQRGFTFQAIDLRWGVPAEAGLDHRTMRICFEELRRSQETSPEPNFLILLGNRYGWRPLPEVISVEEFEKLKQAAELIQSEPPDPARKPTPSQVELLKKAVAVLEDWYLLDENAKPFGETSPIGEYILRSRKPLLYGVDYGRQPDATGKLRDTAAWVDVQFVLWSIVNDKRAFPAADLAGRFQTLHETSPGTVPPSVRFQASATEQEIWQGALQVANADRHVIAAFREIVDLDAFPKRPRRGDFIDLNDDGTPDGDARQALADLKAELERRLSRSPIIRSTCQWAIDQDNNPTGDVTTSHLDDFCREILARFKSIIIKQINAYWDCDLSADDATLAQVRGSQQELDLECADHLRFAGERAPEKTFVGRSAELRRIRQYFRSDTNQPYVVYGPSGSGKTALLGRAILKLKKLIAKIAPSRSADVTRPKTGPIVLSRFIGTTPESSNLRSLLSSLCRELRQDFEMPAPLPTDLNELIDEFYAQLGKATAARPVFVFLDALDQLDAADRSRSVFWIRSPLPSTADATCHARMVVSCLSPSDEFPEDSEACEPFRILKVRSLLGSHELGALDENDARQLFANWLDDTKRGVSTPQHDMIRSAMQKSSACRQPLFLKVLFEEARRWRSFDAPSAIPASLALLLDELLTHLGKPTEHGELIGIALSCLVSARYGLSEGELLEILFADPEYKAILAEDNKRNGHEFPPDSNRIPIAPWTRLRSDLAPYLSERSAPGTAVMHFYHRQVEQAVRKRYLRTPDQQTSRHRQLANYFDGRWNRPNVHALMELPHLRLLCQDHDQLLRLLADLPFSMQKTHAGRIFDLLLDVIQLRSRLSGEARKSFDPWYYFIRRNVQFLGQHPACFFQQAYNEASESTVSKMAQQCWTAAFNVSEGVSAVCPKFPPIPAVPLTFLEWFNRPMEWEPPACLMTLPESSHTVAISADGQTIASGSNDNCVKIWDAQSGECRTLKGHTAYVPCVAISADGQTIVSGSNDNCVKIWDARSGECRTLKEHTGYVPCVAISSNGQTIVSGSSDHSVKIWDAQSGKCRRTLQGHTDTVQSMAISADGQTIVSGSRDNSVKIWDARSGECRHTFIGHTGWALNVAISSDGQTVVYGSRYDSFRVWDAQTGESHHTFRTHSNAVTSVALSADGQIIVSGSDHGTVKIWNAPSSECIRTLEGHLFSIVSVAISADGQTVVSASTDNSVKIWNARSGDCRHRLLGHNRGVSSVAVSADGQTIVSASNDHCLRIWNTLSGECRHTLYGHTDCVWGVALSADGQTIVSASDDASFNIWDARTGEWRETYEYNSAEGQAVWSNVCRNEKPPPKLWPANGLLQFPLLPTIPTESPPSSAPPPPAPVSELVFPGLFAQAYGPLAAETVLAFTANGEAYWFRVRRRDQQ